MNRCLKALAVLFACGLLACLFPCGPASGQSSFYKYVDKNGKVVFTDRLEAVPEQYRDQMKEYKDQPKPLAAPVSAGEKAPDPAAKAREAEQSAGEQEKAEREKAEKLRDEKAKQITELQNQIRTKQQEQRNLRTTWMVYDKIKLNQLNEEIASLEKQIRSLQKELNEN